MACGHYLSNKLSRRVWALALGLLSLKVGLRTILNEGTRRARRLEQWMHRAKHQPRLAEVVRQSHNRTKTMTVHD